MTKYILAFLLLFHLSAYSQKKISLEQNWYFTPDKDNHLASQDTLPSIQNMEVVNLPHDFVYAFSVKDGKRPSLKAKGWYTCMFKTPQLKKEQLVHFRLAGVAPNALVWINGTLISPNNTAGILDIDITQQLNRTGKENRIDLSIPQFPFQPLQQYCGAGLLETPFLYISGKVAIPFHGVRLTYDIRENLQDALVRLYIDHPQTSDPSIRYEAKLLSSDKKVLYHFNVASMEDPIRFKEHEIFGIKLSTDEKKITHQLIVKAQSMSQEVYDEVQIPIQFVRKSLNAEGGLQINNKSFTIKGVNYYPVTPERGSAISENEIRRDLARIKGEGINTIKINAGYVPSSIYQICNELNLQLILEPISRWTSMEDGKPAQVTDLEAGLYKCIRESANEACVLSYSISNDSTSYHYLKRDYLRRFVKKVDFYATQFLSMGNINPDNGMEHNKANSYRTLPLLGLSPEVLVPKYRASFFNNYSNTNILLYAPENIPFSSKLSRLWWDAVKDNPRIIGVILPSIADGFYFEKSKVLPLRNETLYGPDWSPRHKISLFSES